VNNLLPPLLYPSCFLTSTVAITFNIPSTFCSDSVGSPSLSPSPLTHLPTISHLHHPPLPPPRTEQLPADQHTFIITLYYSYRPLVAFSPFVVTCSLSSSMLFSFQRHMPNSLYHVLLSFSPFPLSPSFTCCSLAIQRTIHRTPYTPRYHHIRFTLIPPVPLSSRHHRSSSRIFCQLSIHPSIPSVTYSKHKYLCITIFIHSHSPLPHLPSTLLPPPSVLGCCFPFLLPFFHRYSSNMSTCPLTSSKVLTQSRIPGFLRPLMISSYTIPTCFFYTLRALPLFFFIPPVPFSHSHLTSRPFLKFVYLMYVLYIQ